LDINNRWYAGECGALPFGSVALLDHFFSLPSTPWRVCTGRPMVAELSPVTDFREACCRQYENSECTRGGFCNFMHLRKLSPSMRYVWTPPSPQPATHGKGLCGFWWCLRVGRQAKAVWKPPPRIRGCV
jgi:hypothetical protein